MFFSFATVICKMALEGEKVKPHFKDLPSRVLCLFKEPKGESLFIADKTSLIVKDEDQLDYNAEYMMLWQKQKNKQAERYSCNVLLFHGKSIYILFHLFGFAVIYLSIV